MAKSRKFLQPINLLNSAIDPTPASQGDIYYNSNSDKIKFYDGSQWNDVGSGLSGGSVIVVSETTPTASSVGDAWFKSSTSEFFIWDGTYWVEATSAVGSSTGGLVESGSSYPTSGLSNGKLFYNITNGKTAIFFDSVWKEFSYVTDVSSLDGGLYNTIVFDNSIDGGSSTTTVFIGAYSGESY